MFLVHHKHQTTVSFSGFISNIRHLVAFIKSQVASDDDPQPMNLKRKQRIRSSVVCVHLIQIILECETVSLVKS